MVRKTMVELTDDIDGRAADETVTFGLDGVTYEIDLSAKHAQQLRTKLARYVQAGTRLGRDRPVLARRVRRASTGRLVATDQAQNLAIRDWAKRNGVELSSRGRIPQAVVAQFEARARR